MRPHPPMPVAVGFPVLLAILLAAGVSAVGSALGGSMTPQANAEDQIAPAATGPAVVNRRDLEGMRLGLVMLEPNARRAFADAGIAVEPKELTLDQVTAIHDVLLRAVTIGREERERIAAIVRR